MLNPIVRSTAKILRRNYTMKIRNKTASIAKLRRLLHDIKNQKKEKTQKIFRVSILRFLWCFSPAYLLG